MIRLPLSPPCPSLRGAHYSFLCCVVAAGADEHRCGIVYGFICLGSRSVCSSPPPICPPPAYSHPIDRDVASGKTLKRSESYDKMMRVEIRQKHWQRDGENWDRKANDKCSAPVKLTRFYAKMQQNRTEQNTNLVATKSRTIKERSREIRKSIFIGWQLFFHFRVENGSSLCGIAVRWASSENAIGNRGYDNAKRFCFILAGHIKASIKTIDCVLNTK